MSQNLVSLDLGAADVLAIDAALDTLEKLFAGFVELTPEQRHKLTKMGDRSEAFCRQTLMVLAQNKQMIPPGFDLDEAQSDLLTFDTLRPRIQRLRALLSKGEDTQLALGSDLMRASYDGYALAKVFGQGAALDTLKEAMSVRFSRRPGKDDSPAA
jgi:hypothetical protein